MAFNFKKNIVVGVSVSQEKGLEVAQVDYATGTILNYGCKPLAYDYNRSEISDLDVFKETLAELFVELGIPKGSDVVLNIPTVMFKVTDYPASLNEEQYIAAIEEDLVEHPLFQNIEPCISAVKLPNSTIQFNKVASTIAQKSVLIEIAMQIKELGCKLVKIDTSVNTTLNALIYNNRVDVSPNISWVLLIVEANCCRIIPMQGRNYVDCFEELISIGEVLGDAENYSTVVNTVNPILKNLPSQMLYIVSKTDIISARVLANKLVYNSQIVHQEDNCFAEEPFLELANEVNTDTPNMISLDVIGASIDKEFAQSSSANFNLFNKSLGDIFIADQPPVVTIGGRTFVLSLENMIVLSVIVVLIAVAIIAIALTPLNTMLKEKRNKLQEIEGQIAQIDQFLAENKNVSSEMFDEGDEIRIGLLHNKGIYTYYTIVGTEIPKKLWLTNLSLGKNTTIEGQADNLESVYSFYRNVKDYEPDSKIKLQKLTLANNTNITELSGSGNFDTDSIITSMNADFYEFRISDAPEVELKKSTKKAKTTTENTKKGSKKSKLPDLEPID